jgi:hypothetical protein
VQVLSEVPDFRSSQGRRYPLGAILALACAATLCGYKSYGAMAQWASNYGQDLAQALGFTGGKTPSVGTLHTIFRGLDKEAFEGKLSKWAECVLGHAPPGSKPLEAIALDGKTLRASRKQGACDVHLLWALSHRLGVTLLEQAVADKTNEITAVQSVLKALVLQGRVVTVDALLTQRAVAQTVLEKGGTS